MRRERLFEHITTRERMFFVEHHVVQELHGNSGRPIGVGINRPLVSTVRYAYDNYIATYHVVRHVRIHFFLEELHESINDLRTFKGPLVMLLINMQML